MALTSTIHCTSCDKTKTVSYSSGSPPPLVCRDCTEAEEKTEKERYLVELSNKTIEERIREIEEWIHDHEQVPHGYQSPPRF